MDQQGENKSPDWLAYALIVLVIVILVIVALLFLRTANTCIFCGVNNNL
jgi:hypothetical protein